MLKNRTDNNHQQIVEDLRRMGYHVLSLASLKNACDLLVFDGERYELAEIKNPENCRGIDGMCQEEREQFLTDGEAKFAEDYRVWIVINAKEMDAVMKGYKL